MPTDRPQLGGTPAELAWSRLNVLFGQRKGIQAAQEKLAEMRASARDYLDGVHKGQTSDHRAGILSHYTLIDYIDVLLSDPQLLRRWLDREDISTILDRRVPAREVVRPSVAVLDRPVVREPNALDRLLGDEERDGSSGDPDASK